MTEEEARKKWCPYVRGWPWKDGGTANRNMDGRYDDPGHCCIASDCMAWRKTSGPGAIMEDGRYYSDPSQIPKNEKVREWLMGDCTGYCGLAGEP